GSLTYCETVSQTAPFGNATRSQCSTSVVCSLYGTPFFRSQPSARFVVVTFNARGGGPPPARPAPAGPSGSHSAIEKPCSDETAGTVFAPNRSSRVCAPASLSTFKTSSPCQEIFRRVGTCSRPAAPYALHEPSVFGSHANAAFRPSSLSGMLM